MKGLKLTHVVLFCLLALAMGAGCSKKNVAAGPGDAGATSSSGDNLAELAARNLTEAQRVTMAEVIYFAFDSSELTAQGRDALNQKAQVLKQSVNLRIQIAGHCDERGTEEYNLALGERRAAVAQKYLVMAGAQPNQLETISYGKERPAVTGHDERAWGRNRRDEFKAVW